MYNSISPIPGTYEAGTITRSGGYKSFPAVHAKGGSTKGSSVVTLTGTPAYGLLLQYSVELTNALNGQVSMQTGLFTYNRSSATASLADLISKFASHLARYHDLEVIGTSATTITLRSEYFGFTPNLTIQTPSITAANVQTAATAPSMLVPGDLVVLTPTQLGFTVTQYRTSAVTAASFYGITLREPGVRANDGRDQVYNILTEGYVASQAGGTTAKTASSNLLYIFGDGSRPGMFSFGGLSNGATTLERATVATTNASGSGPITPVNISRQLRPITADVLPGQTFEMQIQGI